MTKDNNLTNTLTNLGLKETEAVIYLAALEQGRSTVLTLAKTTQIKRGTVYEITARLLDRGFLKTAISADRRYFIAEDPKIIVAKFKEYSDSLSAYLPQLSALQNLSETKPKVTYYEGETEVWQIYEDTLKEGQPILSFTSVIRHQQSFGFPKNRELHPPPGGKTNYASNHRFRFNS